MKHKTVLLNEAIDNLNIKSDGIYVDATLGGGGHSSLILKKLGKKGKLVCFDQDDYAIKKARAKLKKIGKNFVIIKSNFENISNELFKIGIKEIDGILYDLGVSSFQLDDGTRGFSYNKDARLDMRMNNNNKLDAHYIVNNYEYDKLVNILYRYGEESFANRITNKIINNRPINTTLELVDIIKSALPMKVLSKKGHPAKKTFQALRIAVNDELTVFERSLNQAIKLLKKDGYIVVITFHSLEDRICKAIFKENSTSKIPKGIPLMLHEDIMLEMINKKPITPSEKEVLENNRAHSAKMRVARKN